MTVCLLYPCLALVFEDVKLDVEEPLLAPVIYSCKLDRIKRLTSSCCLLRCFMAFATWLSRLKIGGNALGAASRSRRIPALIYWSPLALAFGNYFYTVKLISGRSMQVRAIHLRPSFHEVFDDSVS